MIKTFEAYTQMNYIDDNLDGRIPKEGDYVLLKIIPDYAQTIITDKNAKIIGITKLQKFVNDPDNADHYVFELINNYRVYGNVFFIKRYLTDEEIEDYKFKKESYKYNL